MRRAFLIDELSAQDTESSTGTSNREFHDEPIEQPTVMESLRVSHPHENVEQAFRTYENPGRPASYHVSHQDHFDPPSPPKTHTYRLSPSIRHQPYPPTSPSTSSPTHSNTELPAFFFRGRGRPSLRPSQIIPKARTQIVLDTSQLSPTARERSPSPPLLPPIMPHMTDRRAPSHHMVVPPSHHDSPTSVHALPEYSRPTYDPYDRDRYPTAHTYDDRDDAYEEIVYVPVRRSKLSHLADYETVQRHQQHYPQHHHGGQHYYESHGGRRDLDYGLDQKELRFVSYADIQNKNRSRKRDNKVRSLPHEATEVLKQWYNANRESPYPTYEEKQELMQRTGLTHNQVNTWFVNRRCRDKLRNERQEE